MRERITTKSRMTNTQCVVNLCDIDDSLMVYPVSCTKFDYETSSLLCVLYYDVLPASRLLSNLVTIWRYIT